MRPRGFFFVLGLLLAAPALGASLHAVFTDVPGAASYQLYIWAPTPGVTPIAVNVGIPPTTTPGIHEVDVPTGLLTGSPFDAAATTVDGTGIESVFSNLVAGIVGPTPSATPSTTPSRTPTATPTTTPSATPTQTPTNTPSRSPTITPTTTPTRTPVVPPILLRCAQLDITGDGRVTALDAYYVLAVAVGAVPCQ